jgi:hypothetical protein
LGPVGVERKPLRFDHAQRGEGGERLADRGGLEQGIRRDRLAVLDGDAIALGPGDFPVADHGDADARNVQALHLGFEASGGHRFACDGHGRAQALFDALDVGGVVGQRGGAGQQGCEGQDGFAANAGYRHAGSR